MAERTRLARDLHDAVSQTLFSASLVAEVLPKMWEQDRQEGLKGLEEVRQLTRGALAEMRTLLFELRPAALADAELPELLHQLAESVMGRVRLPVAVEVEGACTVLPDVKVALYRIAQEALNNITKHAEAKSARIALTARLSRSPWLSATTARLRRHTGGPRAASAWATCASGQPTSGAAISIESKINEGTRITVVWPRAPGR